MVRSGNVQPQLDLTEHEENAKAKRAFLVGLEDAGGSYVSPSVADFPSTGRAALEVILVNTSGDLYNAGTEVLVNGWTNATANAIVGVAGGTLSSLTRIVGWDSTTAQALVGVAGGTLSALAEVVGWQGATANALVGVAGGTLSVLGEIVGWNGATADAVVGVAGGTLSALTDIQHAAPSVAPEAITFYVGPASSVGAVQFPSISSNLFGGFAVLSPASNMTQMWIGKSTVTTGIGGVGAILPRNSTLSLPGRQSDLFYAAADGTATLILSIIGVPAS